MQRFSRLIQRRHELVKDKPETNTTDTPNPDLTIRLSLLGRRQFPAASLAMNLDGGGPAEATTTDVARILGLAVHVAVLAQVAILFERLVTHKTMVLACRFVAVARAVALHKLLMNVTSSGPCSPLKTRTSAR